MLKSLGEGDEIGVFQVGATFSSEDEPPESVVRATFSLTVRPYLVDGMAVFEKWTAFCL